jgi:ATP-dependent RNA helicase HelY
LDALGERLRSEEEDLQLPRTRPPDAGFAEAAWRWARGQPLEHVLERAELAPGDFVRNTKQLVDLLRQIAVVAPGPDTATAARRAAVALQRGVVVAGAAPALAAEGPETDPADAAEPEGAAVGPADPGEGTPGGAGSAPPPGTRP